MTDILEKHHRQSIRLKGYNYATPGAYFVTTCVNYRKCLLGSIKGEEMILNDAGKMVSDAWQELGECYCDVAIDIFRIMPNHMHGIVLLNVGAGPLVLSEVEGCAWPKEQTEPRKGQPQGVAPTLSLPDVVHRFKTLTTTKYIKGVKENRWPCFDKKLWQRNYYEHVIRNEKELEETREYIQNNPMKWADDENHPDNVNTKP